MAIVASVTETLEKLAGQHASLEGTQRVDPLFPLDVDAVSYDLAGGGKKILSVDLAEIVPLIRISGRPRAVVLRQLGTIGVGSPLGAPQPEHRVDRIRPGDFAVLQRDVDPVNAEEAERAIQIGATRGIDEEHALSTAQVMQLIEPTEFLYGVRGNAAAISAVPPEVSISHYARS
jgi:hypothetical protein